jgi:sigma-B regulation protein RsbU (phosphoserine phosphatase)
MIPEKPPVIPGLDIAATYIPCFDVGGDFYDFLQVKDNCIVLGIADVIGKGIPAAIMMSSFRGAMRAYADTEENKGCIREIINKLNETACSECRNGEFITLFYAAIDVKEETITYCNCGHEPPIMIRNERITELEKGGLVLGVEPQVEYAIETLQLKHGDCLLFYTDGLIDAVKTAKKFTTYSAEHMLKNILGYRRRFVGLARQTDDTSIIIVKVD